MKAKRKGRRWYGRLVCHWQGHHDWSAWRANPSGSGAHQWCKRCPAVRGVKHAEIQAAASE